MLAIAVRAGRVRRALVVVAVAVGAGLTAGSATAAQVGLTSTASDDRTGINGAFGTVTGGAGDDDLRVVVTGKGFDVEDVRAPVTVTGECVAVDAYHAHCVAQHSVALQSVVVEAGAGSDHVADVAGADGTVVRGGDGDDALEAVPPAGGTGGAGRVELDGGAGDDVLRGSSGGDVLTGGPGRDDLDGGAGDDLVLDGAVPEAGERYEGGDGDDRLTVTSTAASRTTVDLAAQAITVAGGVAATASGFERADGTGSGVTLLGDDGPDVLRVLNATGAVLDGRGGDDDLSGGGRATLRGGPGDDVLRLAAGDHADGGAGDDRLTGVEHGQLVDDGRHGTRLACGDGRDALEAVGAVAAPRDCERYVVDLAWGVRGLRAQGRSVRFALRGNGPCGAVVALRASDGRALTQRERLRASASTTAWHPVTLTLRRGVGRPAVLRLALTALGGCAGGGDPDASAGPGTRVARFGAGR
jgi:Ca2+-binding RTX toxin-like protein